MFFYQEIILIFVCLFLLTNLVSPLSSLPSVKEDISSAPDPPTVTSTSELGKIPVEAPCLESMETSIQQDRDVVLPKLEIISEVTEKGSGFQKKPEVEIAVEEISGEEDNPESVEMDISSSPLPPAGVTDEQDMNFAGRDKSVLIALLMVWRSPCFYLLSMIATPSLVVPNERCRFSSIEAGLVSHLNRCSVSLHHKMHHCWDLS